MVNWFILRKDLYFAGKVNGGKLRNIKNREEQ